MPCITWSELRIRKTVARASVFPSTSNSPITHVKPRSGRIIMKALKSFLHNGNKVYMFIVYIYDNESVYTYIDEPHTAPTGNTSSLKNDIRRQNILSMMMKAADFSNL